MKLTQEQQHLVEDNHNLIYSFLNKHCLPLEEYYDLAAIGLCKAAISWNSTRSAFSTFAYVIMQNEVRMHRRSMLAQSRIPSNIIDSLDAVLYSDDSDATKYDFTSSEVDFERQIVARSEILECFRNATERQLHILQLLQQGYTQSEIGNFLGCSQVTISRELGKLRKKICNRFD